MTDMELKILLIEDDEDDYVLTRGLLSESKDVRFNLKWVPNYDAGLEALRTDEFDACLIDYNLGERTGLEFVFESISEQCNVPMILMTGASDRDVDIAAARAGASDYLEKSELTAQLLERSIRYAIKHTKDLVALKDARNSLTEAKTQLETKVQERTKELLVANEALEAEIAERVRAEEQLRHNAIHDRLTQLPNRALFMDRVEHAIGRAKRSRDKNFAVMVINLDRFKVVNDGLGHLAGDELLKIIAKRLQESVRPGDTLARIGGDEFGVLVEDVPIPESALDCANRLKQLLQEPVLLNAQKVFSMFSVGITVSTQGYCGGEGMLQDAFTALNIAKQRGKGRFEVFDISMRSNTAGLLEIESDLRRATELENEFELHYQPIMDLQNGVVAGFEALLRWRHPDRGLVGPNEFIPIAEETGLIIPIGRWVHREAARQLKTWQQKRPAYESLFMSLNVSSRQLDDDKLVNDVRATLEESALEPEALKLEVTESFLMSDPEAAAALMKKLIALGVGLSIDDFGTGYSSLSYLRRFPFSVLKIDRTFVRAMALADEDLEIVQAIIGLAGILGMDVVAEGAETAQEVECLNDLGCQFVQGFYFAPPMRAADAAKMLDDLRDPKQEATASDDVRSLIRRCALAS